MTFTSISPYLVYPDGDAAAEWLTRVLGFGPSRSVCGDDGSWTEGEIAVGTCKIDIHGGDTPHGTGGQGALLIIGVDDVDAQYRRIRDAGEQLDEPVDQDYGPRSCHITDPWGYQWYFWQGEAVYPDEPHD